MGVIGYILVYLIFNPTVWWGHGVLDIFPRPSLIAVLFLTIGCLLHTGKLNWSISRREIGFYLFCGLMWVVALGFGVGMHPEAWMAVDKMTKMFFFIFLLFRVVHTYDNLKFVLWAIIFGGFFIALQARMVGEFYGIRLQNMGGVDFREANALAVFMACTAALAGFEMLKLPWKYKIPMIFAIALMLDALVLTRSRAGFLALVVALPYVLVWSPKRFKKQVYIYTALGAVLFFMLTDTYFFGRVSTIQDSIVTGREYEGEEVVSRLDFWRASVPMLKDNPLGVGPRNFKQVVHIYDPRAYGRDAHNTYVTCYAEFGIPGILLFGYLVISAFLQIQNARKRAREDLGDETVSLTGVALGSIFLCYTVGGMLTRTYLYNEIIWIVLALPICYENAVQKLVAEKADEESVGQVESSVQFQDSLSRQSTSVDT